MAPPREAANGLYFLIGPDSAFFTGKVLWMDGGTFRAASLVTPRRSVAAASGPPVGEGREGARERPGRRVSARGREWRRGGGRLEPPAAPADRAVNRPGAGGVSDRVANRHGEMHD